MRVLVLYKDFCDFLTPKPYNKIPKISDSKNITFTYTYNPAFCGLCKDIRVGHISKKTSEKSKIKFAKSERTGELIGFVSRDSKTRQLKGVRENYALGKQICVLAEE